VCSVRVLPQEETHNFDSPRIRDGHPHQRQGQSDRGFGGGGRGRVFLPETRDDGAREPPDPRGANPAGSDGFAAI
jgi:hypothetical protein